MRTRARKIAAVVVSPLILVLGLALLTPAQRGYAQTQASADTQSKMASNDSVTNGASPDSPAVVLDPEKIAKQLAAMEARIAQLEAELKSATGQPAAAATVASPKESPAAPVATPAPVAAPADPNLVAAQTTAEAPAATPAKPAKIDPFSDWDWTWLNGNPRNKDVAFDSKFFTPEIRADLTYAYSFNNPTDNSMGGSSELFRHNEIQLEQLGLGGDFHYDNVRARFMTQFGAYSTATIRNDPSPAKGQWNLADADRYLAEAYGGYHINKLNGINIDAGIFMSYIGLFSYYNFDNWAYQPSYVSSNTPWFFQGIRVQIFPTAHFKIEPWFINGWQSYGSSNNRHGLGGQIKYTPFSWMNIISNNYGLGHDDLYLPDRGRIHTDNSIEIKYYDKPNKFWDKSAFSFTGDLGCEFGPSETTAQGVYVQGVSCLGNTRDKNSIGENTTASNANLFDTLNGPLPTRPVLNSFKPGVNPKQSFVGYMFYDRNWFDHDKFGITIGGGQINNPGRYLVLVPPINGETAASAALNSPYFPFNPGDPFKAWDSSFTFDYMPKQWLTFRVEYDYRHADNPYWSGHGGVTPPISSGYQPGTNNGQPSSFSCNDGTFVSNPAGCNPAPISAGGNGGVWRPDLRRDESLIDVDWMVKF